MNWPDVSIIMTVLNEERHLSEAVEALLGQDYPGALEIVVAVGPSQDRTREVADGLAARHDHVHVVDNPSGRTPSGLNAAIANSTGSVIVRIDGHAMVPVDYVRTGVETLEATGADNVGGIMAAVTCAMALSPKTTTMYVGYNIAYAFVTGLSYAAFSALVFDAIGHEGHAATKYNGFASLSNAPIWYVGLVLAWAETHWGPKGMLMLESGLGILGIVVFAAVSASVRERAKALAVE